MRARPASPVTGGNYMKLIILDRDGVINEDSDDYIRSVNEWIPIPGSIKAIARLKNHGYTVAVATNQSGLARGYFDLSTLAAMHEKFRLLLEESGQHIDAIVYCPHGPDDQCMCRKPAPGMLHAIARRFSVDPVDIITVGDSLHDYQAARAAGMSFALVKTGKGRRTLSSGKLPRQVPVFTDLSEFVDDLIAGEIC